MARMGGFDPMDLTLKSKSISGFNLSFFEGEHNIIGTYFEQINEWVKDGTITVLEPTVFDVAEVREAHESIQSGNTKGKLVLKF